MRRLLNIILLTILLYILYLAYKGDGVVDFKEVLATLTPLVDTFKVRFCEFFAKFGV